VLVGGGVITEVYNSTGTYQAAWRPPFRPTGHGNSCNDVLHLRHAVQRIVASQRFRRRIANRNQLPLVRITNNSTHHVFYARTHDHSTMGVATGTATVSTNFDVRGSSKPARAPCRLCQRHSFRGGCDYGRVRTARTDGTALVSSTSGDTRALFCWDNRMTASKRERARNALTKSRFPRAPRVPCGLCSLPTLN